MFHETLRPVALRPRGPAGVPATHWGSFTDFGFETPVTASLSDAKAA